MEELSAIPETALWTLYHRAVEARRPGTPYPDPKAVELVEALDYPFAERFGSGQGFGSRLQGARCGLFDQEVADFLLRCPRGTVVCLGDGLETQYWRVDNGRAQWLTVDLPEAVALRERLLPPGPRQRLLACSATDPAWPAEVDPALGVLIVAQGLLMYLQPAEVRELFTRCADRFPGGTLLFDVVPRWFSGMTKSGRAARRGYTVPPMPWGVRSHELLRDARTVPLTARHGWLFRVLALDLPDQRARIVGTVGLAEALRRR
ncbi:class I SAM-dependent methyltransferase [Kitasatospora sp. NBC_00070]|uniref:class I SAM-dependent methyltransferase n=1 Tax=Kitasatospora sp. NBC_00070 TaxID=2975962 RepID=UPI00324BD9BD